MPAPAVIADRRLAAVARARLRLGDLATSPKRRRAIVECRHLFDRRSESPPTTKRRRIDDCPNETLVCLYDEYTLSTTPDTHDDVCASSSSKKARPLADEPSSHALHELEQFRSTLVVVPRPDDDALRTISSSEMRRFRVRTLIEESGCGVEHAPPDRGPCVTSAECFVCVESTLQRVVDRRTDDDDDGEHQQCAVARGDLCAECAARHLAQSSRCPACRRRWCVDDVQVVLARTADGIDE